MLTSREAAQLLGVQPDTIRKLVERGKLKPQRPGARPLTFWPEDIGRLQATRLLPCQRQAIDDTWAQVDAMLASRNAACHDTP